MDSTFVQCTAATSMSGVKPSQRRQRHGAPSGPWPFVDLEDEVDHTRLEDSDSYILPSASACDHKQAPYQDVCWCEYPQSLYPNWTVRQQKKAHLLNIIRLKANNCVIQYLDVKKDGTFANGGPREVTKNTQDAQWEAMQRERPKNLRLRMLFIDDCSGPVLQMIGTRYNIEPFYFSSTIGWTPCRFQSNVLPNKSDNITVVFTFIRSTRTMVDNPSSNVSYDGSVHTRFTTNASVRTRLTTNIRPELSIDAHRPLPLWSNNTFLLLDRLALHMVRSGTNNTIISMHPPPEHRATTAEQLHTRVRLTGKSVYWCNIFKETTDPTFVFLSFFWFAIYAWDESFEHLYNHISHLESHALSSDQWDTTQELHDIRARLQYYTALLLDFTKSVQFVLETPNPSLHTTTGSNEDVDNPVESEERLLSQQLMKRECETLSAEIERLERTRSFMELRLKNVMALNFGRIEIEDNRQRQQMTEASMNDNAAIKQLTYLTMVFLPAGFCANAWSMNIININPEGTRTLGQFFAVALPLTLLSVWIIVGIQLQIKVPRKQQSGMDNSPIQHNQNPASSRKPESDQMTLKKLTLWNRVFWPIIVLGVMVERWKFQKERRLGLPLR